MIKPCTYIDGIGSSQALDTAGEIVDLKGLDCSMLIGGAFTWEHKSDLPAQIIGKILDYKKIFSEKDCDTDRHKMYWEKCQTPFLYVMGRLFNDKKDSAKECAALFLDDAEHPNEPPMVAFSIEGSKLSKNNMIITHSIARKVTITNAAANKTCIAGIVPAKKASRNDPDSLFKGEIEFFSPDAAYLEELQKKEKLQKDVGSGNGAFIGSQLATSEMAKAQVPGSKYPPKAMTGTNTPKPGVGVGTKPPSLNPKPVPGSKFPTSTQAVGQKPLSTVGNIPKPPSMPGMNKALDAGSSNVAPSNLTGGAALAKEARIGHLSAGQPDQKPKRSTSVKIGLGHGSSISMSTSGTGMGSGGMMMASEKKSKWLGRAEQAYQTWEKREQFENFMAKKMPHLTKGEIQAIGQTLALSKSLKAEKKLAKYASHYFKNEEMEKANKIDSGKDDPSRKIARTNRQNEIPANWTLPTRAGTHLKHGDTNAAKLNHEQSLARMRSAPKPNLPKSEEMEKTTDVMMASEDLKKKLIHDPVDPKNKGISEIGAAVRSANAMKDPKNLQRIKESFPHIHKPASEIANFHAQSSMESAKDSIRDNLENHKNPPTAKIELNRRLKGSTKIINKTELEKGRPEISFPGLPKVPTRAETNIQPVGNKQQAKMFGRKVANKLEEPGPRFEGQTEHTQKELTKRPGGGVVYPTPTGPVGAVQVGKMAADPTAAGKKKVHAENKNATRKDNNIKIRAFNKEAEVLQQKYKAAKDPAEKSKIDAEFQEKKKQLYQTLTKETRSPRRKHIETSELTNEQKILRGRQTDALQHHEGLHSTFSHIKDKYGPQVQDKAISGMIQQYDPLTLSVLERYIIKGIGGYNPKSPHFREELLTYARDILTNPSQRQGFKRMFGDKAEEYIKQLKQGHQKAYQYAKKFKV